MNHSGFDVMCMGMYLKLVKIIQIRGNNFKDFDSSSFYDIEICLFYTSSGFFQFSTFHGIARLACNCLFHKHDKYLEVTDTS